MMGIYSYVDTMDNSVVYVGKDSYIDKDKRRRDHMQPSNYNNQQINRVLQNNPNRYKYKRVFAFEDISDTELNRLEMEQIALFNPKFNFTKGGEGVKGFKHSFETRKKIAERNKGKIISDEHRRRISEFHKGKTLSTEHIKRISETHKGKILSEETKKKISEAHKGKKHSEETKRKLSKIKNTAGYYRVLKHKDSCCKQGFIWEYKYYEDGKQKTISSVNIEKLEQKVKAKGLEWYKLEEVKE